MAVTLYAAVAENGLFNLQGKAFFAQQTLDTAQGTTIPVELNDVMEYVNKFTVDDDLEVVAAFLGPQINASKSIGSGISASLQSFCQQWLVEMVHDDNPLSSRDVTLGVKEIIAQMIASSDFVQPNAVTISVATGAGNTGDGVILLSTKRGDGLVQENMIAEDITATVTTGGIGASVTVTGEEAIDLLSAEWPKGSGMSAALSSVDASASLLINGTMEDEDNFDDMPDNWFFPVGTIGTTVKMTDNEIQTTIASGPPTAGHYLWNIVHGGVTKTTVPLAYNADGSTVQSAIRGLAGFELITVVTTGTTPNFTHTITFTGVGGNLPLHTITNNSTGGTYSRATVLAGAAQVYKGGKALELVSNGAELTTMQQEVTLEAEKVYGVSLWALADIVPAAGVFTVDLVDGTGGTVITDSEGVANSFTFNASDLLTTWQHLDDLVTGELAFRMPLVVPSLVYFRIRISTAVTNTRRVFIDQVSLSEMAELYAGGPYAAIYSGATDFEIEDTWTVTSTNDRNGSIQEWYNRYFQMAENGLLLPSAACDTIPDSVIS